MKYPWFYPLLIIIASSSYGILSTIVKLAMQAGFTSAEAVSAQYIFGFMLALVLFVATQRTMPKLSLKGFGILALAGSFTATTGIVYGHSLNYLPASLAVVMLFQFTWIGLIMNCIMKRRPPSRLEIISLLFLLSGTILAAGVLDVDLSQINPLGWILGLIAAFSFAAFLQINSIHVEGVTNIARTFILATVSVILIIFVLSPEILWNGQIMEGLWKYGLALGLFGIILPNFLFSYAAPKVGGALVSILSAMELPVAVIVSVIVLHEALTWLQIIGILIVLIGMSLPSYFAAKKQRI